MAAIKRYWLFFLAGLATAVSVILYSIGRSHGAAKHKEIARQKTAEAKSSEAKSQADEHITLAQQESDKQIKHRSEKEIEKLARLTRNDTHEATSDNRSDVHNELHELSVQRNKRT